MDEFRKQAFVAFLSRSEIELLTLLYNTEFVSVFKCFDKHAQHFCVVKAQRMTTQSEIHQREVEAMQKINHPNVVQLYRWLWYDSGMGIYYMVLVLEHCEMDLFKEIECRKNAGMRYWQEAELWSLVSRLIDAFAYMQYFNIAHRDIKPQNIFLTASKDPKVGDFGSSKEVYSDSSTFTGTPFFLSPKLRQGLVSGQRAVAHNVFKSDVYSLGVTFLFMAALSPPAIQNMRDLAQTTEGVISNLWYSDNLKYLLRCMLQEDEVNRPSFIDVWNWLHSLSVEPANLDPRASPLEPLENQPGVEVVGEANGDLLVPGKPDQLFSGFKEKHERVHKSEKKEPGSRDRCCGNCQLL